ncbi:MAG TPA: hypothetical protein VKB96_10095 [Gammaproteobacteria bacterium]|nr:hypothetical protein [Gammaproteobacteria bacterium]
MVNILRLGVIMPWRPTEKSARLIRQHQHREGLRTIATHFLIQGRQALDAGQAGHALAAISNGLEAAPGDRALVDLRSQIHRQQAQAARAATPISVTVDESQSPACRGQLNGAGGG